jgi:uncharacterized protein
MVATRGNMSNNPNPLDQDIRTWGMLAHLSTFLGYLVPFGSIIAPLMILLIKKDKMPFAEAHAKEALNFQLSVLIYMIISLVLAFMNSGFFAFIAIIIVWNSVFTIVAAFNAHEGAMYRYTIAIQFIR